MSGVQYKRLLVALNRIKQHGNTDKVSLSVRSLCVSVQGYVPICKQSTAVEPKKEPEKIEVFVDGKSVHIEPNTTVLQVSIETRCPC